MELFKLNNLFEHRTLGAGPWRDSIFVARAVGWVEEVAVRSFSLPMFLCPDWATKSFKITISQTQRLLVMRDFYK